MNENTVSSFDGTEIFYKIKKQTGPALVLLHGGSGSSNSWCFQIPYLLEKNYSLIVLDQRGHGLSGRGRDLAFFSAENYAKDLKIVLDNEDIASAVIVGHSYGGQIAQHFYQLFPEKVKALVLISTKFNHSAGLVGFLTNLIMKVIFTFGSAGKPNNNYTDYEKYRNTADLNAFRILRDIKCCSFKTYAATIILGNNYRNTHYAEIKVPSLLIHGKKDIIMPHNHAMEVGNKLNFKTISLPTNHITLLNLPNEISEEIDSFVRTLP